MTNVGRNMQRAYTGDVEEILKFKVLKVVKRKSLVRRLITNKE
jgi:hypothetical protein